MHLLPNVYVLFSAESRYAGIDIWKHLLISLHVNMVDRSACALKFKQEGPKGPGRLPEEKVKGHSRAIYRGPLMLSTKYW